MLCRKSCFGQGLRVDEMVAAVLCASAPPSVSLGGPFFGSTRAASILPSRPPHLTAVARRACQGWPRLRRHPKGLALTGPSTAACLIGRGCKLLASAL